VMEAYEGYWRKGPNLSDSSTAALPEETTRAAASEGRGGQSPTCSPAPWPSDIQRTPGLQARGPRESQGTFWLDLPDQWDPKSPGTTGACARPPATPSTGRPSIRPRRSASRSPRARSSRARWSSRASSSRTPSIPRRPSASSPRPAIPTARCRRALPVAALLLHGRGARPVSRAVGIRTRIRTMERAAMTTAWREKKLKNVIVGITGAGGERGHATRCLHQQERHLYLRSHARRGGPLPAPRPARRT